MINSNSGMGIPMTPEQYAKHWGENAEHFNNNGYYEWMCSQVNTSGRILEIGCGTGFSTFSLIRSGSKKIFVIESNMSLVNSAKSFLEGNNIPVHVHTICDRNYLSSPNCPVEIIVGNLFEDRVQKIIESLEIDCILCWLIGTDPGTIANSMKKTIDALDRNDIAEYRLNVHRECYLIGSRLLSPDGVINFIDRCSISDPDHMDDAIKSFSEQHEKLSEYSFKTINAKFKLLSEFFETSALQYSAQSAVPKVNPILSSVVLKRQG